MNKELLELLEKINTKKAEVKDLADQGKLDEATNAKKELKELQKKFDLLKDVLDAERDHVANAARGKEGDPKEAPGMIVVYDPKDQTHEFAEAARSGFRASNSDVGYPNEGNGNEGGYTVPEDIQTRINHFKEENFSLRQLVNVVPVRTNKGARTYQTKAQAPGFGKVAENGQIQGITAPKYKRISYTIEDYAGYIPVTSDLLADSDANISSEIISWIGRNSLVTDNKEILAILQGKEETQFSNLAGLKKGINVTLGQAYRSAVGIVTNDDGLNYLDTLNDENGRPLLNPNPTEPQKIQLRVGATVIPVTVVPNSVLASESVYALTSDESLNANKTYYTRTGSGTTASPYVYTAVASPSAGSLSSYYEVTNHKMPFIVGDLKEAVTIFDRQQTTILSSNVASVTGFNAFEQRGVLFRAEVRADYKEIDEDAWINGYILMGE